MKTSTAIGFAIVLGALGATAYGAVSLYTAARAKIDERARAIDAATASHAAPPPLPTAQGGATGAVNAVGNLVNVISANAGPLASLLSSFKF